MGFWTKMLQNNSQNTVDQEDDKYGHSTRSEQGKKKITGAWTESWPGD